MLCIFDLYPESSYLIFAQLRNLSGIMISDEGLAILREDYELSRSNIWHPV